MPKKTAKRWPPLDPPARVNAAVELQHLRNNLHARLAYAVQVLGQPPEKVALAAKMSRRGLDNYQRADWDPLPRTMIALDETLTAHLPKWLEEAQASRAKSGETVS